MPCFATNLSWLFTELPFPDRFAAAARAGFRAVKFLFPYDHPAEEVARWLGGAGLECAVFNLPPGDRAAGERGIAAVRGREPEFSHSLDTALDYARALGVRKLHAMAGIGGGRATYIANLHHAAARCAETGVTLLIEPINPRDMPGYHLASLADALAVIEAVGAPNLKLRADLYHWQIAGGDLTTALRAHAALIGHVQIASVPDRHEPDRSELDYRHLLGVLDAAGYTDWIGCEYRPRGRTEDGWAGSTRAPDRQRTPKDTRTRTAAAPTSTKVTPGEQAAHGGSAVHADGRSRTKSKSGGVRLGRSPRYTC